MARDPRTVLFVEDDAEVVDLYRSWLYDAWSAEAVEDGAGALATIDDGIDLVVLDRRLPDADGGEILEEMRELGYDCPVVIVTAVEPDFDIIEMPFDDYLVKPLDRETFRASLSRLADRITYDDELREYYSLAAKKAVLQTRKPPEELRDSDEYARLERKAQRQRKEVDELLEGFSTDNYVDLFQGLFPQREAPSGGI